MLTFTRWLLAAVVMLAAAVRLSGHDPVGKVTWDREIAPIVAARCVSCHSPGGSAPMSLTTYDEVRPWARAIREEVLARRMPQWPVVRGYGDFSNDPSLSSFEIALITAWVDGGAPRTRPAGTPAVLSPVPALPLPSAQAVPREPLEVSRPCGTADLPAGSLLGLRPQAGDGAAVRITIATDDGGADPLLWIRSFSTNAQQDYWLRNPRTLNGSTRVWIDGDSCTVTFLFAGRTGR